MKVKELRFDGVHIGLRIKSISDPTKLGTVVESRGVGDETTWFVKWDGEDKIGSGFYWFDCDCEIAN